MISFFKKKKTAVTDLSWLGIDLHAHLLPGIDDGAHDLEQSLMLIGSLHELGFSKFICTPHIFTELYPNTPDTIGGALSQVRSALKTNHIDVIVDAAAEYMVDEAFTVHDELLCLPEKHILIEMSYLAESPNIEQVIFDLQVKGYKVILAHPERYHFNNKKPERFLRYKELGVLFQLNLLSVYGYYGGEVKKLADHLLEQQLYDLAATDLHHERHLKALTSAVQSGYLHKKLGHYDFKNQELFS